MSQKKKTMVCEVIAEGLSDTICGHRTNIYKDWCFACRITEASLWTKPY